jgi:hypothetical protein
VGAESVSKNGDSKNWTVRTASGRMSYSRGERPHVLLDSKNGKRQHVAASPSIEHLTSSGRITGFVAGRPAI